MCGLSVAYLMHMCYLIDSDVIQLVPYFAETFMFLNEPTIVFDSVMVGIYLKPDVSHVCYAQVSDESMSIPYSRKYRRSLNLSVCPPNCVFAYLNLAVWNSIVIHTCTQYKFWRILIWRFA